MMVGQQDIRWEIQHGDIVTYHTTMGQVRRGRANGLLLFPTHAVLDTGGKHGRPEVVYPGQIVKVTQRDGTPRELPCSAK